MAQANTAYNAADIIFNLGTSGYPAIIFQQISTSAISTEAMRIDSSGNVGIGATSPQYKLSVNGTIGTKEVIVTNTGWADYVFRPNYCLKPLREVNQYIKEHHRLPEIPSEAEVQEKGVGLGEMQVKLLSKIEELTLHMIEAEERNNRLERQVGELQQKVARFENHAGESTVGRTLPAYLDPVAQ
jgi:hypothetical protein